MTYCVGWKTNYGVFVAADSAISAMSSSAFEFPEIGVTSFGERQGAIDGKWWPYVAEEGIKVTVENDYISAYAGDVKTAQSLIASYNDARASGYDPRQAANVVLQSSAPFQTDATVLIGCYIDDAPKLFRLDTKPVLLREVDGLVQIGAPLLEQHQTTEKMTDSLLSILSRFKPPSSHVRLVFTQIICLLQSYGVHDYLVEKGVGGAFVGAWITPSGPEWQGDHLFVVHSETPNSDNMIMCGVMVREHSLCLVGNQGGVCKFIDSQRPGESEDELKQRVGSSSDKAIDTFDKGAFDYFVSINTAKHVVSVLEMEKSLHHPWVSVCPQKNNSGRLGILWSEELIEATNSIAGVSEPKGDELTLRLIPFGEVSQEEVNFRESLANEAEDAEQQGLRGQ